MNTKEAQSMNYLIGSLFFILLILHPLNLWASSHAHDVSGEEFKTETRVFQKLGKRGLLRFNLENHNRLEKRKTQTFGLEYSRFFNKKFFLYAQYERKYGERFDEDWIVLGNTWQWANTNSRGVNWGYLGLGYRSKWDFLPGKNWRFNLKTGLKHNLFNSQLSYQVTPTLTYFSYSDAKLKWSYFLQSDLFYGVNFAKNNIYRWYSYLGFMRHFNKAIGIGAFLGMTSYHWFSTDAIEAQAGHAHESVNTSNLLGLIFVLKI